MFVKFRYPLLTEMPVLQTVVLKTDLNLKSRKLKDGRDKGRR